MLQKFKAMILFEFLDKYPLPTKLKEVEEQSSGRTFRFLHSLNPDTLQSEVSDSLDCANNFWNLPDIKHSRNSSTSGAPTETSITDTVLALWIVSSN